jgi:Holliday junction resolvasome RuvABC DNA-binding subunit
LAELAVFNQLRLKPPPLTALGYSTNEARRAVSNLAQDPGLTLEDRVRLALQQFGG